MNELLDLLNGNFLNPEFRQQIRIKEDAALRAGGYGMFIDNQNTGYAIEFKVVTCLENKIYVAIPHYPETLDESALKEIQAAGSASSSSTVGTVGSASTVSTAPASTLGCAACVSSLGSVGSAGSAS